MLSFVEKTVTAPVNLIKSPPGLTPDAMAAGTVGLGVATYDRIDKIQNGSGFDKAAAITETVLDGAALVAGGKGVGSALKMDAAAGESVTLYRGVNENHAAYGEALQGMAIPRGGAATAAEHNAGNTKASLHLGLPILTLLLIMH